MDELLKLGAVFGIAALPWGEVLIAIPLGIGLGLSPVVTFVVAVAGNVGAVVAFAGVLKRWRRERVSLMRGRRWRWAQRMMNRYGTPGLSAQAPVISGTHVAAVVALLLGARFWPLTVWLTLSIAGWGAAMTVLAVQGKQLALGLFS